MTKAKIKNKNINDNHNHGHNHDISLSNGKSLSKRTGLKKYLNNDVTLWKLIIGLIFLAIDLLFFLLTVTNTVDDLAIGLIWTEFAFATFIFILIGSLYIQSSYKALKQKELSDDSLILLSTVTAYLYSFSVAIIVTSGSTLALPLFFGVVIDVQVIIYIGRYIEKFLTKKTTKEIDYLQSLFVKEATILKNGKEVIIPIDEIKIDDIAVVRNGEIIPLDGVITKGKTTINESSFTGENTPVTKTENDPVFGGSISIEGLIYVKVKKLREDGLLGEVIKGVNKSVKAKPKMQKTSDKIAKYLIPSVLIISIFSLIMFGTIGTLLPNSFINDSYNDPWVFALLTAITVLVVACPCSFAMTTPLSILVGSSVSTKRGIMFSSKTIFEEINNIDAIAFDKTGTLTTGKHVPIKTTLSTQELNLVANAEKHSSHPIAKTIVKQYKGNDMKNLNVTNIIGKGIEINFKDKNYYFGSLKFVNEYLPDYVESNEIINERKRGRIFLYLFDEQTVKGYIELEDKIKPSAFEAIKRLQKRNINIFMITGDNKLTALNIAQELNIKTENVFYEVMPNDKYEIIKKLQQNNQKIAFVGDGVNDAVALTQADLGISIKSGTDIAIESSDVVLQNDDLNLVVDSIEIAKRTLHNIYRGFTIAIIYNAIIIPLTAFGILSIIFGIFAPLIGAILMFFNDTLALFNSLTLKKLSRKKFE